jgi:hypothetical protein
MVWTMVVYFSRPVSAIFALHQIFIISFIPCYEQDVCCTLFCWWKSDNILLRSTMK